MLFFSIGNWWWFLVPVAYTAACRGLWGQAWDKDRRDRDRDAGQRDRKPRADDSIEGEEQSRHRREDQRVTNWTTLFLSFPLTRTLA
jgi:hypothetical protein